MYLPAKLVATIVAERSSLRTARSPAVSSRSGPWTISPSWLMTTPDLHLVGTMHITEMILWSMILLLSMTLALTYNRWRLLNTSSALTDKPDFGTMRTKLIDWIIIWLTVLVDYFVKLMIVYKKTVGRSEKVSTTTLDAAYQWVFDGRAIYRRFSP